jgi:hypothetical protein
MWKDKHHTKFVSGPLDILISSYKTPVLGVTSAVMILFRVIVTTMRRTDKVACRREVKNPFRISGADTGVDGRIILKWMCYVWWVD